MSEQPCQFWRRYALPFFRYQQKTSGEGGQPQSTLSVRGLKVFSLNDPYRQSNDTYIKACICKYKTMFMAQPTHFLELECEHFPNIHKGKRNQHCLISFIGAVSKSLNSCGENNQAVFFILKLQSPNNTAIPAMALTRAAVGLSAERQQVEKRRPLYLRK